MTGLAASFKNHTYLQSSLVILLFFASWSIWWSFFQIWLTNDEIGLGLTGSQVGTIYAVNSLGTLLILFLYGTLQDRLGTRRHLAITAAVIMTGVGPFCIWVYRPLLENSFPVGVAVGSVVLSAGFMAAVGLFEALTERLSRHCNFEYGQARMWGSFGYALLALSAGFLFTIDPELNFWAGSALGLACLLVLVLWNPAHPTSERLRSSDVSAGQAGTGEITEPEPAETEKPAVPGIAEMLGLLRKRSLWLIIVFVLFTWTFYTVFDQQMFPDFYTSLFESRQQGEQIYGVLNSAQVFAEAAMMGLIPILMRKVGVRTALLLGVSVMFIRILGCAVVDDPVIVSAFKMLHALEVPLFVLPIFRYFTLHFNPLLSATLYMVGFQISAQIGNVILSQPLGALRDQLGYQPTFYVIAAIVFAAGVFAFFILKQDDQDVEGDPFVRDRDKTPADKGDIKA